MPLLARVRLLTPSFPALLAALVLGACGEGGGGGPKPADDRAAVERASIAYIEETTSDDEEAENASALDITDVKVDGDSAEAKASSSATGNEYEVSLVRSDGSWQGRTLLSNRPTSEPSGDPASGSGQKVAGSAIEAEIERQLLKPLKIRGKLSCPSRVALRRGNNFECKLTGARRGTVQVTQKNDRGSLNFKINLKAG